MYPFTYDVKSLLCIFKTESDLDTFIYSFHLFLQLCIHAYFRFFMKVILAVYLTHKHKGILRYKVLVKRTQSSIGRDVYVLAISEKLIIRRKFENTVIKTLVQIYQTETKVKIKNRVGPIPRINEKRKKYFP